MISRRDLIHAGCTVAAVSLAPSLVDKAEAAFLRHGGSAPVLSTLSQRNVINLGFLFENDYAFIDHLKQGDGSEGPQGGSWATAPAFNSVIDANGWVNSSAANGRTWGCIFRVPDPAAFSGPYVVDFQDNSIFTIQQQNGGSGTFSVSSNVNCTASGGGAIVCSPSTGAGSFQFTWSSTGTGPQPLVININSQTTSPFTKNVRVYRLSDASDLAAGKVFRAPFKQSLVNLNPSAIRFLNWCGGSDNNEYRFENRALPTNAGYTTQSNWPASPNYATAASGTNIYTVPVATPTASNPKTTPASFQHGEIADVLFTNGNVRGGLVVISAMTNNTNCQVTTQSPHPYITGDTVTHMSLTSMTRLNFFPVTVTVIDNLNYTIGVDTSNTTNYPPFSGSPGGVTVQYCTINVGGRGAKVIAQPDGSGPTSFFGNFIQSGTSIPLVYDKNVALQSDGNGNMIFGAWLTSTGVNPNAGAPFATTPLEIMVALVNEVNAMSVAQGINNPVNMWLTLPFTGLCTMDPDYSTSSDYALNAIDVILNPSSTLRVSGYSALNSKCKLFLEYDNETWNTAGGITGTPYLNRMGFLRWPTSGTNDAVDMYILRSTLIMRAIGVTSFASRIVRVLGGMGVAGFSPTSLNFLRCFGSSTPGAPGNFYTSDTLTVSGVWGTPISNHDAFCTATYFDPDDSYYNGSGTGSFTDDSAMFAGTSPYSSPNQTQAITNFVAKVKTGAGGGQCIDDYLNNSLVGHTADYAAAMHAIGKSAINYEGGTDWPASIGSTAASHTLTAADVTFVTAVINSTQWRDAQVNYFNRTAQLSGSAMPSVYTYLGGPGNQRWAYTMPDSYGGTSTEGQGLLNSPVWVAMSSRNQALPN